MASTTSVDETRVRSEDDFEPTIPPHHPNGPGIDIQDVFREDIVPPARTLLERSTYVPEHRPIETKRYVSREFHDLEMEKLWPRVWQYACWSPDIPNPG